MAISTFRTLPENSTIPPDWEKIVIKELIQCPRTLLRPQHWTEVVAITFDLT